MNSKTELDHGQIVIVAARWLLIVAGLGLLIVEPSGDVAGLRLQIGMLLLLAVGNFYLHCRLLQGKPIPEPVAYVASGLDLVVISVMLLVQPGDSNVYVFYFPALAALSVAFKPGETAVYTLATAVVCGSIAAARAPVGVDALPVIATRVLMLVAVAFCGACYWVVERQRRVERRTS
jgi:hypothetical protein